MHLANYRTVVMQILPFGPAPHCTDATICSYYIKMLASVPNSNCGSAEVDLCINYP